MKNTIENKVELLSFGMINADRKILEELVLDELSYGHSNGKIQNKDEFINAIVDGISGFKKIELLNQVISIHSSTAIVRHIFTADTYGKGKEPAEVRIGNILIFINVNEDWKLMARQAYKLP